MYRQGDGGWRPQSADGGWRQRRDMQERTQYMQKLQEQIRDTEELADQLPEEDRLRFDTRLAGLRRQLRALNEGKNVATAKTLGMNEAERFAILERARRKANKIAPPLPPQPKVLTHKGKAALDHLTKVTAKMQPEEMKLDGAAKLYDKEKSDDADVWSASTTRSDDSLSQSDIAPLPPPPGPVAPTPLPAAPPPAAAPPAMPPAADQPIQQQLLANPAVAAAEAAADTAVAKLQQILNAAGPKVKLSPQDKQQIQKAKSAAMKAVEIANATREAEERKLEAARAQLQALREREQVQKELADAQVAAARADAEAQIKSKEEKRRLLDEAAAKTAADREAKRLATERARQEKLAAEQHAQAARQAEKDALAKAKAQREWEEQAEQSRQSWQKARDDALLQAKITAELQALKEAEDEKERLRLNAAEVDRRQLPETMTTDLAAVQKLRDEEELERRLRLFQARQAFSRFHRGADLTRSDREKEDEFKQRQLARVGGDVFRRLKDTLAANRLARREPLETMDIVQDDAARRQELDKIAGILQQQADERRQASEARENMENWVAPDTTSDFVARLRRQLFNDGPRENRLRVGDVEFDDLVHPEATREQYDDYKQREEDERAKAKAEGRQNDFRRHSDQLEALRRFWRAYKPMTEEINALPPPKEEVERAVRAAMEENLRQPMEPGDAEMEADQTVNWDRYDDMRPEGLKRLTSLDRSLSAQWDRRRRFLEPRINLQSLKRPYLDEYLAKPSIYDRHDDDSYRDDEISQPDRPVPVEMSESQESHESSYAGAENVADLLNRPRGAENAMALVGDTAADDAPLPDEGDERTEDLAPPPQAHAESASQQDSALEPPAAVAPEPAPEPAVEPVHDEPDEPRGESQPMPGAHASDTDEVIPSELYMPRDHAEETLEKRELEQENRHVDTLNREIAHLDRKLEALGPAHLTDEERQTLHQLRSEKHSGNSYAARALDGLRQQVKGRVQKAGYVEAKMRALVSARARHIMFQQQLERRAEDRHRRQIALLARRIQRTGGSLDERRSRRQQSLDDMLRQAETLVPDANAPPAPAPPGSGEPVPPAVRPDTEAERPPYGPAEPEPAKPLRPELSVVDPQEMAEQARLERLERRYARKRRNSLRPRSKRPYPDIDDSWPLPRDPLEEERTRFGANYSAKALDPLRFATQQDTKPAPERLGSPDPAPASSRDDPLHFDKVDSSSDLELARPGEAPKSPEEVHELMNDVRRSLAEPVDNWQAWHNTLREERARFGESYPWKGDDAMPAAKSDPERLGSPTPAPAAPPNEPVYFDDADSSSALGLEKAVEPGMPPATVREMMNEVRQDMGEAAKEPVVASKEDESTSSSESSSLELSAPDEKAKKELVLPGVTRPLFKPSPGAYGKIAKMEKDPWYKAHPTALNSIKLATKPGGIPRIVSTYDPKDGRLPIIDGPHAREEDKERCERAFAAGRGVDKRSKLKPVGLSGLFGATASKEISLIKLKEISKNGIAPPEGDEDAKHPFSADALHTWQEHLRPIYSELGVHPPEAHDMSFLTGVAKSAFKAPTSYTLTANALIASGMLDKFSGSDYMRADQILRGKNTRGGRTPGTNFLVTLVRSMPPAYKRMLDEHRAQKSHRVEHYPMPTVKQTKTVAHDYFDLYSLGVIRQALAEVAENPRLLLGFQRGRTRGVRRPAGEAPAAKRGARADTAQAPEEAGAAE